MAMILAGLMQSASSSSPLPYYFNLTATITSGSTVTTPALSRAGGQATAEIAPLITSSDSSMTWLMLMVLQYIQDTYRARTTWQIALHEKSIPPHLFSSPEFPFPTTFYHSSLTSINHCAHMDTSFLPPTTSKHSCPLYNEQHVILNYTPIHTSIRQRTSLSTLHCT